MIEWIRTYQSVPKNSDLVLVLLYGEFDEINDNLEYIGSKRIFEARFFSEKGWICEYAGKDWQVMAWMELPKNRYLTSVGMRKEME